MAEASKQTGEGEGSAIDLKGFNVGVAGIVAPIQAYGRTTVRGGPGNAYAASWPLAMRGVVDQMMSYVGEGLDTRRMGQAGAEAGMFVIDNSGTHAGAINQAHVRTFIQDMTAMKEALDRKVASGEILADQAKTVRTRMAAFEQGLREYGQMTQADREARFGSQASQEKAALFQSWLEAEAPNPIWYDGAARNKNRMAGIVGDAHLVVDKDRTTDTDPLARAKGKPFAEAVMLLSGNAGEAAKQVYERAKALIEKGDYSDKAVSELRTAWQAAIKDGAIVSAKPTQADSGTVESGLGAKLRDLSEKLTAGAGRPN